MPKGEDTRHHSARKVGREEVGQMSTGESIYFNPDSQMYEDESGLAQAEKQEHVEGTNKLSRDLGQSLLGGL